MANHSPMPAPGVTPRVMQVVTVFPRPEVPYAGTWCLVHNEAVAAAGAPVLVACITALGSRPILDRAKAPRSADWGPVHAEYVPALSLRAGPFMTYFRKNPSLYLRVLWRTCAPRMRALVRDFRPDVLVCHGPIPAGDVGRRLSAETGIPYVVFEHGLDDVRNWVAPSPDRRACWLRVVEGASRYIGVTGPLVDEIKKLFPQLSPMVLHNGVHPIAPQVLNAPRPPELAGKRVVFSAGFFYPRKLFPLLVEAFARATEGMPDAVLRIAGDGETRPAVEQAIDRHGLRGRVTLLGTLPYASVMQEMAWSDVFALVSSHETFATVFLEAAAAGKPSIWCTDGGITDVLRHGEHGLGVPPEDLNAAADALATLLRDEPLRRRMGAAASELFRQRLSSSAYGPRLLSILRDVVASTPARAAS